MNGNTVAIWQDNDLSSNDRLTSNTQYSVSVTKAATATNGSALYSAWSSRFTTTGTALNDTTPPTLTLTVEPSVDPSYVLPGQLVVIDAYAADQGSGVARVELRIKDLTANDTLYTLGAAAISLRHTLALVNLGGAKAAEVLALAEEITAAVEERFGIRLEMEPVLVGF